MVAMWDCGKVRGHYKTGAGEGAVEVRGHSVRDIWLRGHSDMDFWFKGNCVPAEFYELQIAMSLIASNRK